jgi:NADH:ubiquinone oxidoreductase subunit F (NADH-binding)
MANLLDKIKKVELVGRGGASFPVYLKWKTVKSEKSLEKYLVINGAEGEPGIYKDAYIINNYPEELMGGVKIASDFIKAKKIYFYLNKSLYDSKNKLNRIANSVGLKGKIVFFLKPVDSGYIAGEESTILNIIEGKNIESRLRPPFPACSGLFGAPTLINNIETIYNVYLVSKNKYQNKRFYSINFDKKNKGVYFLSENLSIKQILKETNNYPDYNFFVQIGGDASGEVLNSNQLNKKVDGAGSITIYNLEKHWPEKLLKYWLTFFRDNSCGKCTPCREGTYRLCEMFDNLSLNMRKEKDFSDLCDNLFLSSFCALGTSAPIAVLSYFKNVYEPLIVSQKKIKGLEKNVKRKK